MSVVSREVRVASRGGGERAADSRQPRRPVAPSTCSGKQRQPCSSSLDAQPATPNRRAFTLVEMLVVIFVMLILLVMTVTAVNFSMDAERIRGAARQLQSYLAGARDRAINEKEARGVRLLVDSNMPSAVTSVVYIRGEQEFRAGRVNVHETPSGSNVWRVAHVPNDFVRTPEKVIDRNVYPSDWWFLAQKGLLVPGSRIRIPEDGIVYVIQDVSRYRGPDQDARGPDRRPGIGSTDPADIGLGDDPYISLTIPFLEDPVSNATYRLFLPPSVLPNQEPTLLARNIVIDLNRSKIPAVWRQAAGYTSRMDIIFSPRGTVIGAVGAMGSIHFYLSDASVKAYLDESGFPEDKVPPDSMADDPNVPEPVAARLQDRLIVTVFTATGAVSCHPVDGTDADGDGYADDPFRFAETGQVAGQ